MRPATDIRPPDADVVVRIDGVSKIFRDFWGRPKVQALDAISLDIRRGEVFGLLGPNGAGKSTTIKILLGLLFPTSGHVRVFGESPRKVETKSRVGYLPEESYLHAFLSARETLHFYGRLFPIRRRELRTRVEQLLEMTGLTRDAARPVGEYSKGMARRVGLAQALINDPELIILDEPTSGLDPAGCRAVKDVLLALARRGKTILLCSHILADVEDVCDRVAILHEGRIRATGRVQELLEARHRWRMTLPDLPEETVKRIVEGVRREIDREPEMDHPAQSLERFFLDVIEHARMEHGAARPGASARIAEFLTGDARHEPRP